MPCVSVLRTKEKSSSLKMYILPKIVLNSGDISIANQIKTLLNDMYDNKII